MHLPARSANGANWIGLLQKQPNTQEQGLNKIAGAGMAPAVQGVYHVKLPRHEARWSSPG